MNLITQQHRRRAGRWITLFLLAATGLSAGATQAPADPEPGASASATAKNRNEGCRRVVAPAPKNRRFHAPRTVIARGERLTAVVRTNCGSFEIALDAERAPLTVNSFVFLAERGFYNGLTFHRAVQRFVIQGGDPLGTGFGGPGYHVDEKPPPGLTYRRGTVAMAKSATEPAGRSGSQFFITLANAGLPPDYALLGKVSRRMYVVRRIGRLATPTEEPRQTVLIEKISIRRG